MPKQEAAPIRTGVVTFYTKEDLNNREVRFQEVLI